MALILPSERQAELPPDLPITIVDDSAMTYHDEEMILAMMEHMPESKFKPGDLAYIREVPPYLKQMRRLLPRIWQIRFIISAWQHELMRLVHEGPIISGIDHAYALLDQQHMPPEKFSKPILYAHGYPHGLYPDTAAWFPQRVLQKVVLRETNQAWQQILDEAKAPFLGYDDKGLMVPYTFDLAPDLYSNGENLGRPFSFEEATTHTAALLGMEELLFRPVDPFEIQSKFHVDPENDIFKR